MSGPNAVGESVVQLRLDLLSAKVLVSWLTAGRDLDLTSEAHLFFADRYERLAEYHRRHGHERRARRLQDKADEHLELGGGDGPPYAAAMGMPHPRRWVVTEALARRQRSGTPRDAA